MFMFVVERAGPNSPNDTREITKYCKLPNGNVPLRHFSRIYSRRCRGVCNKHTWFILLVPYQCSPMAVGPSDISGNDWLGSINSSPAADRKSDEIFGANLVSLAEI